MRAGTPVVLVRAARFNPLVSVKFLFRRFGVRAKSVYESVSRNMSVWVDTP